MLLKFRNNSLNNTSPNILIYDERRRRQRNERNFSLKIEKLYGLTRPEPIYIGIENSNNILGTESIIGLGIENQPQV